ncbi:MAG TPA: hypothetical protein VLY04_01375 [Bryobacteraceae bacterium]|nr:hypothetical protein [Bryobacteraceae bacterium]
MSKRTGLVLFLLLAASFLTLNRAAYKGYFTDDDFEHLSWTRGSPAIDFLKGALSPRFQPNNFRPVGHFVYHEEGRWFGFRYTGYLLVLHLAHLLNAWLIWLLARRLGVKPFAAAAGCLFFALHMGFFEAVWKPAYIFDVLCATFCLLTLLCYTRGRWLLSFVCYWLAYKAKEPAVMLPFVLACYELWFGQKRWKPLVPFFVASLSFGIQGLLLNPNRGQDNAYAFRFTLDALAQTAVFYASRIFLVPFLGFAVPIAAYFSQNRRIWFGIAAMVLFFVPMLFLPGRIETAYCYLPFAGLAIALAGLAETTHPALIAAFFLLWFPLDLHELRLQRRDKLARDDDARTWVTTWQRYAAASATPPGVIIWSGEPLGFGSFGIQAAIKCAYRPGAVLDIRYSDQPTLPPGPMRVAFLTWDGALHKLDIVEHTPQTHDVSYLDATTGTPVWQLGKGWYGPENRYRWIAPDAAVRLDRPSTATHFELLVLASATLLEKVGPVTVRLSLDGRDLPSRRVTDPGWQTLAWDLAPAPGGPTIVTIHTQPPFHPEADPRVLGLAVGAIGFR